MKGFSVKIYSSDLPPDEKERRLWDVLEFLLRSKKQERNEKKRARGKGGQTANAPQKGHTLIVSFAS